MQALKTERISNMAASPTSPSFELLPAFDPPPGVHANFRNPPSRAYKVNIAAGVCLPFMVLFAFMRLYARAFLLKSISKSDYACLLGLAAGVTYIGITIGVAGGVLGKHQWDFLLGEWSTESLRLGLTKEAIYGPLIWIVKVSLFLLILEIFGPLKWLRIAVWLGLVTTGLFYYSYMIILLVVCAPKEMTQLAYLEILGTPQCLNNPRFILPVGIMNVFSDVYLMLIPLPAIWGLQIPLMKKIGISTIFLTGSM